MSKSRSDNQAPGLKVVRVPDCPVCGSNDVLVAFGATSETREQFRNLSEKKYLGKMNGWEDALSLNISYCPACDHHWHAEQPDKASLMSMYAAPMKGRGDRKAPENIALDEAIAKQARNVFAMVSAKKRSQATLLEFGGGLGRWGNAFQAAGFDVTAYEPVSERTERGNHSTDKVVRDLAQLDGVEFDAINIEQVLEHLTDPVGEMRRLKEFCTKNTVIRITVPNFSKFATKQDPWVDFPYAGRMHILSPYEHLQGFSARSLQTVLLRAGYKEISLSRLIQACAGRVIARRFVGACSPSLRETAVYAVPNVG
jgi:hypothetical protein